MSDLGLNLKGMTIQQVKDLNVAYVIEADLIDGRPIEDICEEDTYYLTVSGDIVVKSLYIGTNDFLFE